MTNLAAAMRMIACARQPKHPAQQRAHTLLSMRPSSLASLFEGIRRGLLLVVVLAVAGVLVEECLSFYRQRTAETALSEYRTALYDLASTVRAIRTRARNQRQPFELHVDQARRSITISSLSRGSMDYMALERTIWLPKGLEISEAPLWITAQSSGGLTPASLVFVAPAFQRLFRLITTIHGTVELHEVPTS